MYQAVKEMMNGTSRYEARNYDLVFNAEGKTEEQIANQILAFME